MSDKTIKIVTIEYDPITGAKTVEKEITVREILLQYKNIKKEKTEKAKTNTYSKQR
jgi:hypothetical protein